MRREPLLKTAIVTSAVGATMALLVTFGLPLTQGQQNAVLTFLGAWWPILTVLWARPRVTPVSDPRNDSGEELVPKEKTE